MADPASVAFVCGCSEPGASGVGDYSLGLAAALRALGVDARVIAVRDPKTAVLQDELVNWQETAVPCRRLPAAFPAPEAAQAIESWLAAFAPAWVSLQFVPFAFHPKGIVTLAGLPWSLFARHGGVHVMFHEVWIGDYLGSPWTSRMWGRWQRIAIKRVVRKLRPRVVHTSNPFYRHLLQQAGIAATVLPIFGNVPVVQTEPRSRTAAGEWLGGFFGTIHPGFPAERCFDLLRRRASQSHRHLRILSVGRAGAGEVDFISWRRRWPDIAFDRRGPQSAQVVSRTLATFDFGIASTPLNIIGKSGSAAALNEHGAPVLCGALGSGTRGYQAGLRDAAPGAYLLEDYVEHELDRTEPGPPVGSRAGAVARKFLVDLTAKGKGEKGECRHETRN